MIESLFWALMALLVYLHGGYALLLALAARLAPQRTPVTAPDEVDPPAVAVVVAAYNEENVLGDKLESLLAQDYAGPLRIFVISDRSTDRTEEIARSYADRGVRLIVAPERRGKAANISALIPALAAPLVLCTDATGRFAQDAIRLLAAPFRRPDVGLVGGRIVYRNIEASGVSRGEGLYWRYEVALRTLESRTGGTVIVSGGCYLVRRELFQPVPPDLPDDAVIPLNLLDRGYRVLYEPEARVEEEVATTLAGGFRTKIRIVSRNAVALWSMRRLLAPWPRPGVALKLWSHRLLRWLVAPQLLTLLAVNLLLLPRPLYIACLGLQATFYALALGGLTPRLARWRLFGVPLYFCLVNLGALIGVWRAATGRISGVWQPVERSRRP